MFDSIFKLGSAEAKETLDRHPGCVGHAAVNQALRLVILSGDRLIERALSNAAHAMLACGCTSGALSNAVAAVRCGAHRPQQKALYRAGAACAALSQPQAALYFLDQARFPSICHCSPSRRPLYLLAAFFRQPSAYLEAQRSHFCELWILLAVRHCCAIVVGAGRTHVHWLAAGTHSTLS